MDTMCSPAPSNTITGLQRWAHGLFPLACGRGTEKHGHDPKPSQLANTKVDGVVCWHHALPPGHTFPGMRQGPGTGLL